MKIFLRKNSGNLLNFCFAGAFLFAALGCSGFVKGFKEGYEKGKGTSSNSSSTAPPTGTKSRDELSDLTGAWTGRSFDNSKKVQFFFTGLSGSENDRRGTATTTIDGVEAGKESYRVIDDKTVEFETKQGMRYRVAVEITPDGEKLTMINPNGITTSFQRE